MPDTQDTRSRAIELQRAQRWREAASMWERVLAATPGSREALFGWGVCLYRAGDQTAARSPLAALVAGAATQPPTTQSEWIQLGQAQLVVGDSAEAESAFAAAIACDPDTSEAEDLHRMLAVMAIQRRADRQALEHIAVTRIGGRLDPRAWGAAANEAMPAMGSPDEAKDRIAGVVVAILAGGQRTPDDEACLAGCLDVLGRTAEATEAKVRLASMGLAGYNRYRAVCRAVDALVEVGDYDRALAVWHRRDGDEVLRDWALEAVRLRASYPILALMALDKALGENPADLESWHLKSVVLASLGRVEEAEINANQALAIDTTDAVTLMDLASLALIRRRPVDALPFLDRALAAFLAPSSAAHLVVMYRDAAGVDRADAVIDELMARDVAAADVRAECWRATMLDCRADIQRLRGDSVAAAATREQAAALEPTPARLEAWAEALLGTGQDVRAGAVARQLTRSYPDHARGHSLLGHILLSAAVALEEDGHSPLALAPPTAGWSSRQFYEAAAAELGAALSGDPLDAHSRAALATALEGLGESREARLQGDLAVDIGFSTGTIQEL